MRVARIAALSLIAGGVALAAHQLARRTDSTAPVYVQGKVKVISSIPRHESGSYDLGDITLLNDVEAWAVGYDEKHPRRVYHSKDGGDTWEAMDVPGNNFTMKAVSFPDTQHGWAVGGNGLIIRTANGGRSWELLKAPTSSDLQAVHFVNARIGFVGGRDAVGDRLTDEVTGSFEILRTKDGGETWRRCYGEKQPDSFFQIASLSESIVFVVLDGNRLMRTDNQGETWKDIPLSVKYVTSIAFAPDGVGWMVGPQGTFQSSEDGGKNWRQSTSLAQSIMSKDWEAIGFNSKGQGLAVGKAGSVALTSDSGKTWELLSLATSDNLRAIRMHGSSALILGAKNIYHVRL
jgi:photosystem II stability/assembly factor-like uncharacterized protein